MFNNSINFPGKFIAIEGIDGSGTTTQTKLLYNWMKKRGYKVHFTKEPTGFLLGQVIRLALKGELKYSDRVLALLFAADRLLHTEKIIIPKLRQGIHVISDRYVMSSIAYQGSLIDEGWVREINRFSLPPTLTIYIDVPVRVSLKRIMMKRRKKKEIYEEPHILERVRKMYIEECMRNKERCIVINGDRGVNEVHSDILKAVRKILD